MKVNVPFTRLLFFIVLASFFISCKKNPSSSTQCRLTAVRQNTSTTELQLTYNTDNKLSVITYSPGNARRTFTYSGNFIFISQTGDNGMITELDTIALNSNGRIAAILRHTVNSGLVLIDTMIYDNNNQLINLAETETGQKINCLYTWQNGDIVSVTTSNDKNSTTQMYDYYTDKQAIDGDYFKINQFLGLGAYYLVCHHLYKGSGSDTISYTFDSGGKITSTLYNGTVMYSYTYTCD
ncbi:MAG: hypothetical protein ACTHJ0_08475 [Flavipsychrobacter sp.]